MREALTRPGPALSGAARVEIHADEASVISAAIARRLGYRLDRAKDPDGFAQSPAALSSPRSLTAVALLVACFNPAFCVDAEPLVSGRVP